jgi:hypothetical protein
MVAFSVEFIEFEDVFVLDEALDFDFIDESLDEFGCGFLKRDLFD